MHRGECGVCGAVRLWSVSSGCRHLSLCGGGGGGV